MKLREASALLALTVTAVLPAVAQESDCYSVGKIPAEHQSVAKSTVVMLDETVVFDEEQRRHIHDQLTSLLELGSELRIVSFSAYLNGRYAAPTYRVKIAAPLEESVRRTMRKDQLRSFDTCQDVATIKAKGQLKSTLEAYAKRSSDKVAKSAILGTLKEVGDQVFPSLVGRTKRLVMVSDMLENSDVSSFYSAGSVRMIEPPHELASVDRRQLATDFRGARVFVIGAGVTQPTSKDGAAYRSTAMMKALQDFWRGYFEKSNARLVDFGQPLLLNNLSDTK